MGVRNYKSTVSIWRAMVNRCTSPRDPRWTDYGGRGIRVCERWILSCQAFVDDMGYRPDGLVLDRINNNGDYCKENCHWTTYAENNSNKRAYKKAANNTSGVQGVSSWTHNSGKHYWRVYGGTDMLYRGHDFFEACCIRKSWEAKRARQKALLG